MAADGVNGKARRRRDAQKHRGGGATPPVAPSAARSFTWLVTRDT